MKDVDWLGESMLSCGELKPPHPEGQPVLRPGDVRGTKQAYKVSELACPRYKVKKDAYCTSFTALQP